MIQVVFSVALALASATAQITVTPLSPTQQPMQQPALFAALPEDAQVALDEARAAYRDALTADRFRPDEPLVRETIRLARRAVNLAPDQPETLRFLAEVYGDSGFYGPAFSIWRRFAEAGGNLDADARRRFAESGVKVGYARYNQGNPGSALAAYRTVTEVAPDDETALRWSGRILLEQNRPQAALPYWQRVQRLSPDDAGAAYFLDLTEAGVMYGLGAAEAFFGGVSDYEAGRLEAAREAFGRATRLAPGYAEAWGYRGRVAFEAGDFSEARTAYARASRLEPQNDAYRYFLRQAEAKGN